MPYLGDRINVEYFNPRGGSFGHATFLKGTPEYQRYRNLFQKSAVKVTLELPDGQTEVLTMEGGE